MKFKKKNNELHPLPDTSWRNSTNVSAPNEMTLGSSPSAMSLVGDFMQDLLLFIFFFKDVWQHKINEKWYSTCSAVKYSWTCENWMDLL